MNSKATFTFFMIALLMFLVLDDFIYLAGTIAKAYILTMFTDVVIHKIGGSRK